MGTSQISLPLGETFLLSIKQIIGNVYCLFRKNRLSSMKNKIFQNLLRFCPFGGIIPSIPFWRQNHAEPVCSQLLFLLLLFWNKKVIEICAAILLGCKNDTLRRTNFRAALIFWQGAEEK